jgi:FKBP-type peptidyl-prolyl cis-trans isomerase FklB
LTSAVSPLALQLSALFQIKAQPHSQSQFMKSILFSAVALFLAVSVFAEEKPPQLKDLKDKASYSIGLNFGFNFKRQNIDLNSEAFAAGFKDAMTGKKPLMSEEEVRETMMAFEKDMQQKQAETAQKNVAEAEKFLAANKAKEGVKATASGLQYKVLKEGSGAQPKSSDTVTVNYRGTLIDGTEFDSSYKRGQPAVFPVGGVIKGWTEALQLMKVGSKFQLFIPANLAYGEQGRSGIPPNSLLIFEVELMDVKSPPAGGASPEPSAK